MIIFPKYNLNKDVSFCSSSTVVSLSAVFCPHQATCRRGSRSSSVTSGPTRRPGRPESTQLTCTCSPSASTCAPPSCPPWLCTSCWSTSRPGTAGGATRGEPSCCCATPGSEVGHLSTAHLSTAHLVVTWLMTSLLPFRGSGPHAAGCADPGVREE